MNGFLRGVRQRVGHLAVPGAVAMIMMVVVAFPVAAQGPLAANPQMRHFWHVFAAYAIAWVLVFGWVVSIVRRLKRVEERLEG